MTNVFNKIMKTQKQNNEDENKEIIRANAQSIIDMFLMRNLTIAQVQDTLRTVQQHFDISLLRLNCKGLFIQNNLPEGEIKKVEE